MKNTTSFKKPSEGYFLETGDDSDATQTGSPQADTVVEEVHTDRPEVTDPKATSKEEIDQTFALIEEMIEGGYRFSDEQMDIGIKMSLTRLPRQPKAWFLEICTMIAHRPMWQVLWGSFNRVNENGQAQAPILDPTWETGNEFAAEWSICRYCNAQFPPKHYGQIFCSNEHSNQWNVDQRKDTVNASD